MFRARRVGDDRLERVGHDVAHPNCSSEVIYEVCPTHLGFDEVGVQDVTFDERDFIGNRCEIGEASRREIVENRHAIAIGDECRDEMGTDESCSTSDEDVHSTPFMCAFRLVVRLVGQMGKGP